MTERITLKSDNTLLENAFNWAQNKIKQFVVTGTKQGDVNRGDGGKWYGPNNKTAVKPKYDWAKPKDYIPAFWAGYYDRTAFYIRDFVHQAAGAHLANLDEEIYSMYKTFIDSACEETGGYALWAFNFDGSIYYMDTPNYKSFVRELTAQFELVELAYRLYLWTGDRRYVEDEKILEFTENILTDFIDNQDGIVFEEKNGIPEGKGDIWQGSATYNERGFHAAEAGDCIAAMYQAILAYSEILNIRNDKEESKCQRERAEKLKEYFNSDWSVIEGSDAYCYAIDVNGKKHYKWYKKRSEIHGGASLVFIPLKELAESGKRTDRLLDYIHHCESDAKLCEDNIESYTYLPQIFFPYNQNNRAWHWMKYIINRKDFPHEHKSQGTNGDYPEISFTLLEHTISGLIGIRPNSDKNAILTFPHLPDEINFIKAENIPIGNFTVNITVRKNEITLSNNGSCIIKWSGGFYDNIQRLYVNGNAVNSLHKSENGIDISYTEISVARGQTAVISNTETR